MNFPANATKEIEFYVLNHFLSQYPQTKNPKKIFDRIKNNDFGEDENEIIVWCKFETDDIELYGLMINMKTSLVELVNKIIK